MGRRTLLVLAGTILGGLLLTGAGTDPGTAATVGECVASGQVWLHVQTETGEVLRSECVGTPDGGLAALETADVAVSESKGGYLCTMAGHPERCPSKFTGQYWQYWHAAAPDADWTFSQKGADEYHPQPGSLEGWCYNAEDEKRCELPLLSADQTASERIDHESASVGLGPWMIAGVAFVVLTAVGVLLARRRRNP